jgi:hypothetical protein
MADRRWNSSQRGMPSSFCHGGFECHACDVWAIPARQESHLEVPGHEWHGAALKVPGAGVVVCGIARVVVLRVTWVDLAIMLLV